MRPRISVSDLRAVKSCLPANVTVLLVDKDNTVTAPYALHCHPAYQVCERPMHIAHNADRMRGMT